MTRGLGFGPFDETDLGRELGLIEVNIRALHILTKLFYRDFVGRAPGTSQRCLFGGVPAQPFVVVLCVQSVKRPP